MITYKASCERWLDDDSQDIHDFYGSIYLDTCESDEYLESIGAFAYTVVYVRNRSGLDTVMMCDYVSQELYETSMALEEGGFFDLGEDFMYFNRLELKPEYRGRNIGINVMHDICSGYLWANIIINPFPLQCERGKLPEEVAGGKSKLIKHYKKIGFFELDEEYMVLPKLLPAPPLDDEWIAERADMVLEKMYP